MLKLYSIIVIGFLVIMLSFMLLNSSEFYNKGTKEDVKGIKTNAILLIILLPVLAYIIKN